MTFKLLKVGSDTEFFLRDLKTGLPVTAIGRFGGTKKDPKPVLDIPGFCIQEDNVMPEVNIPAADNYESFYQNCDKILSWLKEEAASQGCSVDVAASMNFTTEQLDHPQAKTIGCEPDYCVWTREENQFDETKRHLLESLRSAGGHIHVSFTNTKEKVTQEDQELLVMFMDVYLGLPSVIQDRDTERRKLYGKAGSFRFKPYGIEYRVLSNFWFKSARDSAWVFNQVQLAVNSMNNKGLIRMLFDDAEEIQTAINIQDESLSHRLMDSWGVYTP